MPAYRDLLSSDERWDVVFYTWRLSVSPVELGEGKKIYDQSCASCHGEDGSGELLGSADFTDLRQMDNLAPRDLYLTVTQGRGSMPAWQSLLSVDERWAVIDYLRSLTYDPALDFEVAVVGTEAGAPTDEPAACSLDQTNPLAWEDTNAIQAGQALYLIQCAMCHGPDGSGGLPETPDFTSTDVNDDLYANPGRFFCSVSEGSGVMPAFGSALSNEELWQVLTYIGSLGP
jgi:mono/diheme cytochrome c family protein